MTDNEGSWISDVALYRDYFGSAEVLVRSKDIPEVTRVADVMSVTSFCREIFEAFFVRKYSSGKYFAEKY